MQEKLFSYGIALLLVATLTGSGLVVGVYMILGFSHFIMTWMYQLRRQRPRFISVVLFFAMFTFLLIAGSMNPSVLAMVTSIALILHVFNGEIRHFNRPFSAPYIFMTAAIVLMLSSWAAMDSWALPIDDLTMSYFVNGLVVIACLLYFRSWKAREMDYFFPLLVIIYCLLIASFYAGYRPVSPQGIGFVIIAHCLTTYFNVTKRFFVTRGAQGATKFIIESLVLNGILILLFILAFFVLPPGNVLIQYGYNETLYYVAALMHFTSTLDFAGYSEKLRSISSSWKRRYSV